MNVFKCKWPFTWAFYFAEHSVTPKNVQEHLWKFKKAKCEWVVLYLNMHFIKVDYAEVIFQSFVFRLNKNIFIKNLFLYMFIIRLAKINCLHKLILLINFTLFFSRICKPIDLIIHIIPIYRYFLTCMPQR